MIGLAPPRFGRSACGTRGSTLIEIAMGVSIMAMVFVGVMGAFIQSRRMTETSIFQNSAVTVIQGYMEQIKNMDFSEIPYYSGSSLMRGTINTTDDKIYTQLDSETLDVLRISPGTPIDPQSVTLGQVPEGVVDNEKLIDINDTPATTDDDLLMHIWIWVAPLDNASIGVSPSRSFNIVYTWSFTDGGIKQTHVDAVATIRSVVPTF